MPALRKIGRRLAAVPGKTFWFMVGSLSLMLGAIGVVLPILPTTPFVILAAFAYSRSAPGFALRLENHRIFGPIIADWRTHGAIAKKYKVMALSMMAAAFLLGIAAGVRPLVLMIQAVCLCGAALFILTRPHGPTGGG